MHREVPWFAIYLVLVLTHVVVDGYLFNVHPKYFYFFIGWIFQGAGVVLELMVTMEAMRNVLVDYPTIRKWGRKALPVVGIALLFLAVSAVPYGPRNPDVYAEAVHLTMRSARIIQVGLIVAFFALTRYLALPSRHYQFGILLGLGLYVSASLACEAYIVQVQLVWAGLLIDSFAYLTTLLIWLTYIYREEPSLPPPPVSSHSDLDSWSVALVEMSNQNFGKV